METVMQFCNAGSPVVAFLADDNFDDLTDLYISQGRIGLCDLSSACFTWSEVLRLVASELWRCGEADAARVTLKAGRQTVREFLRTRFGIVTGARQFCHRESWTPDRADLWEFLGALRNARSPAL
jgi:hypothetical protein